MPCAHLFGFEIAVVLATDVIHTRLKLPCNLIFLPVLLSLHLLDRMHAQAHKGNVGKKKVTVSRKGRVRKNHKGRKMMGGREGGETVGKNMD